MPRQDIHERNSPLLRNEMNHHHSRAGREKFNIKLGWESDFGHRLRILRLLNSFLTHLEAFIFSVSHLSDQEILKQISSPLLLSFLYAKLEIVQLNLLSSVAFHFQGNNSGLRWRFVIFFT